jgi:hypothetical protein
MEKYLEAALSKRYNMELAHIPIFSEVPLNM